MKYLLSSTFSMHQFFIQDMYNSRQLIVHEHCNNRKFKNNIEYHFDQVHKPHKLLNKIMTSKLISDLYPLLTNKICPYSPYRISHTYQLSFMHANKDI